LVSILGGMACILGIEFITHNNVFIEGHNRLIIIPSKTGIVQVKAHEVPSVGGSTIHLMLGKTLENECMGGYGMLCVMCVLDKFEPKEVTNLVSLPKCIKWMLDKFLDVMPEKLRNDLPSSRRVNHVIKVMSAVTPPAKAHIEWVLRSWRNSKFNLKNYLQRDMSNLTSHHMGHLSSLFTRRMGH